LFDGQPECVICLAAGRHTIATVRDHIVALAAGGADVPANTQPLCWDCNEAKRQQEARRWKTN
jgi:5-methylcytosine-specific restriction endonuclease McrA